MLKIETGIEQKDGRKGPLAGELRKTLIALRDAPDGASFNAGSYTRTNISTTAIRVPGLKISIRKQEDGSFRVWKV